MTGRLKRAKVHGFQSVQPWLAMNIFRRTTAILGKTMAFQRFIGPREVASTPKVTIQARGLIDFNEGACRRFVLSRFNYAVLYYDQETSQIGIQFGNNSSEHGALRMIKKPNGITIPATLFLRQHNLLKNSNFTYNVHYSGEYDMYIIQLAAEDEKAVPSEKKDDEEPSPLLEEKEKKALYGSQARSSRPAYRRSRSKQI